jgi:Flp pilus assembly protein TadG
MPGRRRTHAQSMVEFAIVIPLFLLLLFALIDFGRLLFSYASLANGARELARSMTVTTNSASTVVNAFNNLTIIGGALSPASTVTLQPPSGSGGGSIACTSSTSPMCTIKITTTSSNVTLTSYSGASGSAVYTTPTYQFNPTSTGDFVMLTWLGPDPAGTGLLQGYIQLCQLPVTAACSFPSFPSPTNRGTFTDGFLQVDVGYNFQFNPLFQNRLSSVVDVSFMRPASLLTTSVRMYAE